MLNTATPTWQRDFVVDRVVATRALHIWWLVTRDNLDVEDEPSMANYPAIGAGFAQLISGLEHDPEIVSSVFALQQTSAALWRFCGLSAAQFKALTGAR
jgi:hypothetical protein